MRKTRQGTLAVLLALAVLAGGALALLTRQNQKAEEAVRAAAEGTISLSRFAADDLSEIVLETGGETLTLKTDADGWTLAEDPAYHLDATACSSMRTALADLHAKRRLTAEAGEDYGLADPQAVVTVTAGGETQTFRFGAENPVTGDVYLQKEGDEAVYTVASAKLQAFLTGKAGLFGAFCPAGITRSDIEAVELTGQSGETVRRTADSDEAEGGDDVFAALSSYVTGQITHADPAEYGFDHPLVTARVTTAEGEKTLRYAMGTEGYYLQVAGDDSLYAVDGSTVQTLLDAASQKTNKKRGSCAGRNFGTTQDFFASDVKFRQSGAE